MMMGIVWRRQKRRKSHIDEDNQRAMEMPINWCQHEELGLPCNGCTRAISVWKLKLKTKWVCIQLACSRRPRAFEEAHCWNIQAKFYNEKLALVYESDKTKRLSIMSIMVLLWSTSVAKVSRIVHSLFFSHFLGLLFFLWPFSFFGPSLFYGLSLSFFYSSLGTML